MKKLHVKCECQPPIKHDPKVIYVIRRVDDGGFQKDTMFFTLETAQKYVRRGRKFYEEDIMPSEPRRTWDSQHYLVKCEIVEVEVLSR